MLNKTANRTCSFGLSGLFGLSGYLVERNKPDEPNQLNKPDRPDRPASGLQPEYLQPEHLSKYRGLGIEDVNEYSCPGRGVGFSHDVLDVFFHGLFGNQQGVCDLFVGPPLCQVLNDGLFAIG
jgi:hypothetical protein